MKYIIDMANIRKPSEKASESGRNVPTLTLAGYIGSISDLAKRRALKDGIMDIFGITSDVQLWRYTAFKTARPTKLEREAVAALVREASGNEAYTGDSLFPKSAYNHEAIS